MPIERMIPADEVNGIASTITSTRKSELNVNLKFIVSPANQRAAHDTRPVPSTQFFDG